MLILREKVFAYITYGERLLVFSHPDFPEAGIQVPAGTMHEGEDPEEEVMREAFEETGLRGLRLNAFLGECDFPAPERNEVHRRRFYHLVCDGEPPERWRHDETDPGDGTTEAITFELFWVKLRDEVPQLSPGHEMMLARLFELLSIRPSETDG
jgi:8-oxo-dGTP diphosphatase